MPAEILGHPLPQQSWRPEGDPGIVPPHQRSGPVRGLFECGRMFGSAAPAQAHSTSNCEVSTAEESRFSECDTGTYEKSTKTIGNQTTAAAAQLSPKRRRSRAQGGGAAQTPGAGEAGAYNPGAANPAYDSDAGAKVAADDSNAL